MLRVYVYFNLAKTIWEKKDYFFYSVMQYADAWLSYRLKSIYKAVNIDEIWT